MNWDAVHHSQQVYRQLVQSFSYPGTLVSVAQEAGTLELETAIPGPLLALLLTLLDREVSFWCADQKNSAFLHQLTGARPAAEIAQAAFVLAEPNAAATCEALEQAYAGNLIDPQTGASVLIEMTGSGPQWRLRGPGILDSKHIHLGETASEWVPVRSRQNREFPLGLDVILWNRQGEVVALPRTTQIEEVQ